MTAIDSAAIVLHVLFAGLWTGAIVFFAWRIYPLVAAGDLEPRAAEHIVSGLQWLTRGGAIVFLATGGHMAANRYSAETLFSSGRGHLVLSMLGLWLLLTGVVEGMAAVLHRRLEDPPVTGADARLRGLVWSATALALVLLVVAGLLAV